MAMTTVPADVMFTWAKEAALEERRVGKLRVLEGSQTELDVDRKEQEEPRIRSSWVRVLSSRIDDGSSNWLGGEWGDK